MNALKDAAALCLIEWHFETEPELRTVYRILAEKEDSAAEPIKLLEVNDGTYPTGTVEPFGFSGTDEIPFRTVIAEITSEEFELLRDDRRAWPEGWDLRRAMVFERPKAA